MQDNGKSKKSGKRNKQQAAESATGAAYETFALAGGKSDPQSGATIPTEEGVKAAKKFVEENKK